jgi:hypothetical protein
MLPLGGIQRIVASTLGSRIASLLGDKTFCFLLERFNLASARLGLREKAPIERKTRG